jgi:L,D-transpeptidase ErfK/SrfK
MRWVIRGGALVVCLVTASACTTTARRHDGLGPPAALPPVEKITELPVRVPRPGDLSPVVGRVQRYRIVPKDTLLDVARNAGLGFQEVKNANRDVDEWIPPAGLEVVVPTRWVLPRTSQRGIVVNVPEMRMYMFPPDSKPGEKVTVRTWAVAIGTDEAPTPVGPFKIISKDKNPTWYVPDSIYKTMDKPRRVVPPGPDNPMGAYRIRLEKGLYSIHGSDTPWAIGRETTHGCLRLYPEDIGELYSLVKPPMNGELVYEPVKVGASGGRIFIEVHDDVYHRFKNLESEAWRVVGEAHVGPRVDRNRLRQAVRDRRGVPVDVTSGPTPHTVLTQRQ